MTRILHLFYLSLFIILLSGCATNTDYSQAVNHWRGTSAKSLQARWGTPNQVIPAPNGHVFYLYTTESKSGYVSPLAPSVGVSMAGDKPVIIGAQREQWSNDYYLIPCTTQFEIDQKNTVISTKTQGNCAGNLQHALDLNRQPL